VIDRGHYQPTKAQREELRKASEALRAKLAQRRATLAAAVPILNMLRETTRPVPLDNPVVGTDFGAL
jgi:hypothetical protein